MALDKKFKKKWVKALRSGEFAQGDGCLMFEEEDTRYHCCLGVAKELHIGRPLSIDEGKESLFGEPIGLSEEVQDHLSLMNDDGHDFGYIADYIEENL